MSEDELEASIRQSLETKVLTVDAVSRQATEGMLRTLQMESRSDWQNHMKRLEKLYEALVKRHRMQENIINSLHCNLGEARATGRCVTYISVLFGFVTAMLPLVGELAPSFKEMYSHQTACYIAGLGIMILTPILSLVSSSKMQNVPSK